ncbi:MAG: PKD domain-containing protein [Vicingaceae bacterium]
MKQSNLNQEEEALRKKLEEVHFSYQANDWVALEKQLPKQSSATISKWLLAGLLITAAVGASYFLLPEEKANTALRTKDSNKKEAVALERKVAAEQKEKKTENIEAVPVEKNKTTEAEKNSAHQAQAPQTEVKEEVAETTAKETPLENENEAVIPQESIVEIQTIPQKIDYQLGFILEGKLCRNTTISARPKDERLLQNAKRFEWKLNNKVIEKESQEIELTLDKKSSYTLELVVWDDEMKGKLLSLDTSFEATWVDEANFTYLEKSGLFNDFDVDLQASTENNKLSYTWIAEGQRFKGNSEYTHTFPSEGIYTITLEVKDENGCKSQVRKPVSVENDFTPFINGFTPDGKGPVENETFIPNGFGDFDGNFEFIVYDLQSNVVYRTTSVHEPWNGKLNNKGALLPAGNYVWKVRVSDNKGNQRAFSDKVTLRSFN